MHNVVIIGSGCAGLTAAIYAGRANLKPLVLDGHEPGGQLSLTTHVENYPGFPDGIMGPELIENMRKQAQKFGAEFKAGAVTEVDVSKRPFKIIAGKDTYEARSLIVAAGASARLLGLKGERELIGHGVSTCATCDGYFFRGKPIAVVGGGDSAMEEANFLSRYASRVHLIHRRNEFRASKIMIDRARANEKVEFVTPYVVEEIVAPQGHVEGVSLRNQQTRETREIPLDGDEYAVERNLARFPGLLIAQAHAFDVALGRDDFLHDVRSDELDFLVGSGAVNHDLGSPKLISSVDEMDPAGVAREKVGLFHSGIAAADHGNRFSAEEIAVASRAGGNAVADQFPFALQT